MKKKAERLYDEHEEDLRCVDDYEVAEMLDDIKSDLMKSFSFGDDE